MKCNLPAMDMQHGSKAYIWRHILHHKVCQVLLLITTGPLSWPVHYSWLIFRYLFSPIFIYIHVSLMFSFLSSHDTIHLYTFPVLTAILVYFVNHCTGLQFERLNWTGSPPNPAHLTSPPHVQTIWQVPVPRPSSSFRHSGKAITC